jgi:outer membrane protein OmpU
MNNFKKIGLSALAGSLVATSAFAGSMDVSGSAKIAYKSNGKEKVTGNPFSNTKTISFSGSGEIDNGWAISTGYSMTDASFSSSYVSIDMGDAGTFSLQNGTDLHGLDKYQDVMPTAGEQVWDDVDTNDYGVVDLGNSNALGYSVNMMGVTLSTSYSRTGLGTETSAVIVANDLIDGVQVGYGIGTDQASSTSEDDLSTGWIKYTSGPATVGVQLSSIDKPANDIDRKAAAISFAVNESLSVSYGISTVDFEQASKSDEESSGISASYTMGGMTIGAVMNKTDSVGGTSGTDSTFTELSVAFAF